MIKNEHRTNAYVFSADPLSCDSMQQINTVQRTVRAINARNKLTGNPKRFRVSLKGRLGKNNPNAVKYRRVKGWATGYYTGNTYQTIRLADAQRIDVYIHAR
jgi:hypothetical protein